MVWIWYEHPSLGSFSSWLCVKEQCFLHKFTERKTVWLNRLKKWSTPSLNSLLKTPYKAVLSQITYVRTWKADVNNMARRAAKFYSQFNSLHKGKTNYICTGGINDVSNKPHIPLFYLGKVFPCRIKMQSIRWTLLISRWIKSVVST